MRKYSAVLVLDFETTGLSPQENYPTEVAVKRIDWRGVTDYSSMIMLPEGVEIPEKITELTGLTTEKVNSEGAEKEGVLVNLMRLIDENTLVVGHNVNFDLGFLFHHFGIEPAHFMCTRTIEILTAPHLNASLQNVYDRYFPEKRVQEHRAMSDVEMTSHVLEKQVDLIGKEAIQFFRNRIVHMPDRDLVYTPHNAIVLDFAQKYDSVHTTDKLRKKAFNCELLLDSCEMLIAEMESFGDLEGYDIEDIKERFEKLAKEEN
jgi:DNA polymerase III subunit epsilon